MNYRKIYNALIYKRTKIEKLSKQDQYCELHHIIPRSFGGSDNQDNLVNLTAREHYIAHRLLEKITAQENGQNSMKHFKMTRAVFLMSRYKKFSKLITSKTYEQIRLDYIKCVAHNSSICNKGRKMSNARKLQNRLDSSSRKWMCNKKLNESHFVKPADIKYYLDNGFVFGRILDQSGLKNPIHNHIFTAKERKARSLRATISNKRRAKKNKNTKYL